MPLADGTKFAGYTILRLLGSGGMGEVYLAQHPRLPRHDALKVLPEDVSADPDYRERFLREADLAAALWHANIVGVHDRGEHEGRLWIAMDFVDGSDAAQLLAERYPAGMPTELVVEIVSAVARALDYSHKRGMLHRDVKPANIMLTHDHDDGEQRVLLADFGIARDVNDISGLTTTNMAVGTVAYSPPEQLMGEDIDGRADQYALAATTFHLLTGAPMFQHSNPAVVIGKHLNAEPPRLAHRRPELAAFDAALALALSKNPGDRFSRCMDFAGALTGEPVASRSPRPDSATRPSGVPPPPTPPGQPSPPRNPHAPRGSRQRQLGWKVPALLAVVLLAMVIGLGWQSWQSQQSERTTATASPTSQLPKAYTSASPSTSTPLAAAPVFPTAAIETVLLSPSEVSTIAGASGQVAGVSQDSLLKVDSSAYGMSDNTGIVTPRSCAGVIFTAEHEVYANSGFIEMRHQVLKPALYSYDTIGPFEVEQMVAVFPSLEQAQTVLASSRGQWQSCAKSEVAAGKGEAYWTYNLGEVSLYRDVLTVPLAAINRESGDRACQQAMGARANVIVSTHSCRSASFPVTATVADPRVASDDSEKLVNAMLDKVKV